MVGIAMVSVILVLGISIGAIEFMNYGETSLCYTAFDAIFDHLYTAILVVIIILCIVLTFFLLKTNFGSYKPFPLARGLAMLVSRT